MRAAVGEGATIPAAEAVPDPAAEALAVLAAEMAAAAEATDLPEQTDWAAEAAALAVAVLAVAVVPRVAGQPEAQVSSSSVIHDWNSTYCYLRRNSSAGRCSYSAVPTPMLRTSLPQHRNRLGHQHIRVSLTFIGYCSLAEHLRP